MVRTYAVGRANSAVRLDEHTGPWVDLVTQGNVDSIWRDVMSDPSNPDKVVIVGTAEDISLVNVSIQVSFDAGVTWTIPTGTWANDTSILHEVWYVDTNIIWAVGENGVVVKSIDGGLSFNTVLTAPGLMAEGDVPYTAAIHALDNQTAVVLGSPTSGIGEFLCYVWKTINGGNTWTILNGGNTLLNTFGIPPNDPVGRANGIWISEDEQRIVAATGYTQQLSIDGGITFTQVSSEMTRSGVHLTWFPSYDPNPQYFRHVGGVPFEVNESTDSGVTYQTIRAYNFPILIPPTNTAVQISSAHFYTAYDGYYGYHIAGVTYIASTNDGAASGLVSYTSPNPFSSFEAIWTSEFVQGPPFYQIVNCENNSTICVTNDMSSEVLSQESFQIEGFPNDCWTAEEIDPSCINPIPIVKLDTFIDCPTCLASLIPSSCYQLEDCAGLLEPIITNENLSAYLGTIISIKDEEGHEAPGCWLVTNTALDCEDGIPIQIYKCYADCEACLPPEPCPIVVKPRKVEPNYITGNCDPYIVESILCKHSDIGYHRMMQKRFGIQNCCPVDEVSAEIKFQKINLSLIKGKNPTYDPCNPICYSYEFLVRADDESLMTYTDCDNVVQIINRNSTNIDVLYQFCALNPVAPTVVITHPNNTTETFYLEPVGDNCDYIPVVLPVEVPCQDCIKINATPTGGVPIELILGPSGIYTNGTPYYYFTIDGIDYEIYNETWDTTDPPGVWLLFSYDVNDDIGSYDVIGSCPVGTYTMISPIYFDSFVVSLCNGLPTGFVLYSVFLDPEGNTGVYFTYLDCNGVAQQYNLPASRGVTNVFVCSTPGRLPGDFVQNGGISFNVIETVIPCNC